MRKILFVMLHPGFIRYYEDALLALAHEGHDIRVAFEISRTKLREDVAAREFAARSRRIALDVAPTRPESVRTFLSRADRTATRSGGHRPSIWTAAGRVEAWESLATTVRLIRDYLRYFEPEFAQAHALRSRAEKRLPRIHRALTRGVARTGRLGRHVASAVLGGIEHVIPTNPDVEAFVSRHHPDLLLVTPLIELGSQQVDYVKCARRLGIRSAHCVASWDNLTSKGLIRVVPDHVVVWNELQKREAVTLHGVRPEQVVVTGAQLFDRWFEATPGTARDEFCQKVGLDPDRPYLLYVGSSTFIAPDEVPFVERWLGRIRDSSDPAVAGVGVLIRPHPANDAQWRAFDQKSWPNVAVHPLPGTDPTRAGAWQDYFDSIFHSVAVVGVNTSAQIEAGVVGRPVLTVRAPEFAHAQEGTLHFRYLVTPGSVLVHSAASLGEHVTYLSDLLADPGSMAEASSAFLHAFIRPQGLHQPSVPVFAQQVQSIAEQPPPPARTDSVVVRVARAPALALAWVARTLAEDRPSWIYLLRPFVTAGVWLVALVYRGRSAWRDKGYPRVKELRRSAGRYAYDVRKRASRAARRARKPLAARVRGAMRRLAGRDA